MRIISGTLKGRQFDAPKQLPVRPTTSFAKEALFNILDNTYNFDGLKVLDLCSGIGSISFEFYSRGVEQVISVDSNPDCCRFQQGVIRKLDIKNIAVLRQDAIKFLKQTKQQFDIIFVDPPYDVEFYKEIPDLVFDNQLLSNIGWLVIEHPKHLNFNEHPKLFKHKKYGKVNFSIFSEEDNE
jgi:16S rRNA (guanine(966)-N(2))-methyltransferase RsmD